MEEERKISKVDKFILRRSIKMFRRKVKKDQKKLSKGEITEEKLKAKVIKCITELQKDINLYEDDDRKIPTTLEHLEQKSLEELTNTFEDMIKLVEDEIAN